MSDEEKLEFVERVLNVAQYSLKEEDFLEDIYEWDQDSMENFQAEFQNMGKDIDVEELKNHIISNTHIKDIKVGYIDKTMSCCCGPKTIAIFVR